MADANGGPRMGILLESIPSVLGYPHLVGSPV